MDNDGSTYTGIDFGTSSPPPAYDSTLSWLLSRTWIVSQVLSEAGHPSSPWMTFSLHQRRESIVNQTRSRQDMTIMMVGPLSCHVGARPLAACHLHLSLHQSTSAFKLMRHTHIAKNSIKCSRSLVNDLLPLLYHGRFSCQGSRMSA